MVWGGEKVGKQEGKEVWQKKGEEVRMADGVEPSLTISRRITAHKVGAQLFLTAHLRQILNIHDR